MKGFVLKLQRARDEDIIATLLTPKNVRKYYRFYGARHSILQMGYLIDFEEERDKAQFLPRLRRVTHIGFPWLYDRDKLMLWHQFIAIFDYHFRDVEQIDSYYFNKLLEAANKWKKQSPRRLIVETFIDILKYEGRLNPPTHCVICNNKLDNSVALIRGFLPTHPECSKCAPINKRFYNELLQSGSTVFLDDISVEVLSQVVLQGF